MIELKLMTQFPHEIIATDEAGRGPLGGPVVVAALRVHLNSSRELKLFIQKLRALGVMDSKKVSSSLRHQILVELELDSLEFKTLYVRKIFNQEVSLCVWDIDHERIDNENILAASLSGMKEACLFLSKIKNHQTTVLIDGHKSFKWTNSVSPWRECPIIKGDFHSALIGLASLIAKEKRDHYMRQMHEIYPQYGFNQHFGYPTKAHREKIKIHGPCPIHRKTFKGVKEFIRS